MPSSTSRFAPLLQIQTNCQHLAQWRCVSSLKKREIISPLNQSVLCGELPRTLFLDHLTLLFEFLSLSKIPPARVTIWSYLFPYPLCATIASFCVCFCPRNLPHKTTGVTPATQNRPHRKNSTLRKKSIHVGRQHFAVFRLECPGCFFLTYFLFPTYPL